MLRPAGLFYLNAPSNGDFHRYPVDCWRIMPDGMRYLFEEALQLERYDIGIMSQYDIGAAAWKVTR